MKPVCQKMRSPPNFHIFIGKIRIRFQANPFWVIGQMFRALLMSCDSATGQDDGKKNDYSIMTINLGWQMGGHPKIGIYATEKLAKKSTWQKVGHAICAISYVFFFRLSHLAQDYELEMHGNATCIPIQDTRVLLSSDFLRVPASQVRVLVPAFVLGDQLEWSLTGM